VRRRIVVASAYDEVAEWYDTGSAPDVASVGGIA